MLTKDQAAEWADMVDVSRGWVTGKPDDPNIWGHTCLAVDAELTTLRTCLVRAREALAKYANPRITTDYTGDEWERVDGPDTARHALATIDSALGKEEKSGC